MIEYLSIMLNARKAQMDERGASAVEYGLLIAGIAAVIVAVVLLFGKRISSIFSDTCSKIGDPSNGTCTPTTPTTPTT